MKVPKRYSGIVEIFGLYWKTYGGWKAFFRSPYLDFSVVLSFFCYPIWLKTCSSPWYNIPLSVIPNLLGFTLGGYAILLAFGSEKFLDKLAGAEADGSASPYMEVNAAFIHFILIQALSLFLGLIGIAWKLENPVAGFIGFTTFTYALSTLVAACLAIFRVAHWYDLHVGEGKNNDDSNNNSGNSHK